ncbi:hypothetical protein N7536_000417 [Penicillium majusculum]|nr:hypothetical protein N7536_000417 [Penicillium majusculum]
MVPDRRRVRGGWTFELRSWQSCDTFLWRMESTNVAAERALKGNGKGLEQSLFKVPMSTMSAD